METGAWPFPILRTPTLNSPHLPHRRVLPAHRKGVRAGICESGHLQKAPGPLGGEAWGSPVRPGELNSKPLCPN